MTKPSLEQSRSLSPLERPVPISRESLIAEWEVRAAQSQYLWLTAARWILNTLREHSPENALARMRELEKGSRALAVNACYERAVRDLETLLQSTNGAAPLRAHLLRAQRDPNRSAS